MASLDLIRTIGFRRWYERQLIECHAWLLTWFLALIVLVTGVELVGQGARAWGVMLALCGLALSWTSWRRYRRMLEVAEALGMRADCPSCGAYARFKVKSAGPTPLPDGGDPAPEDKADALWMKAKCSRCGCEWALA